ncbi:hypothetical protein [Nonomuraea typhae]|uniref:hypothetical protein n=1 Tax=Nonomuraea typhae TaxID=2603600 RepID=UPI0012FC9A6D|nr:hypothetical protein [Nonomuraea typhae]
METRFLIVGGFVAAVLSSAVAALLFLEPGARVAVVAVLVGAYATWGRSLAAALATGVMAWMFATGFLVNGLGVLSFSPDDLVRLAVLLAVGVSGYLLGAGPAMVRALGGATQAYAVRRRRSAAAPPRAAGTPYAPGA